MTSAPRSTTAALKTQYMALYAQKDCALITVKELAQAAGVARTMSPISISVVIFSIIVSPQKRYAHIGASAVFSVS